MNLFRDFAATFGTCCLLLLALSVGTRSTFHIQMPALVAILAVSLAFAAIRTTGRAAKSGQPVGRDLRARGSGRRLAWRTWS